MSPITALNFTLLSGILILRTWWPHFEQKISEAVAIVILAHSGLALLSNIFSTEALIIFLFTHQWMCCQHY
jgi:hypothetical protein